MTTKTRAPEEATFQDVAALIADEKAAALAAFDPHAFRMAVLRRFGARPREGWTGSLRLAGACGFALLLAAWAVLAPPARRTGERIDVRVVERAVRRSGALRTGSIPTPAEPALSNEVWSIERALLTWRRQQAGAVDVVRALCGSAAGSRACPAPAAEELAAPGARRRLERALIDMDKEGTIHRALVGRRRT